MLRQLKPRRRLAEVALKSMLDASTINDANPAKNERLPMPTRSITLPDAAVVQIVSIVESYLDSLLVEGLAGHLSPLSESGRLTLLEIEQSASSTWQSRQKALTRYLGVRLTQAPEYPILDASIQFRNCLVHGLGHLTTKQRDRKNLEHLLRNISVSLGGNRMRSRPETLQQVRDGCMNVVRWVDETAG